jgi:TP901 family phage tail tape measure protein
MSVDAQMKIAVVLSAFDKMSKVVNDAVNKSQAKLASFARKADEISNRAFRTGRNLTASGLAVGLPLVNAIEKAKQFEDKMIDIRKQMSIDTPETVARMTKQVMDLSKELPIATGDIQDMIAAGLRMGIAEDKVIEFTKSVTKMSVAFDMVPAEISDSMGKIANVFKIPIDKVGDFADAINFLDDNTMAKGSELIDVLQRIGGSTRNLSPNQAAALSSTMLSLGESAETSGTGISIMINRLSAATMQGGRFQAGLRMLNMDATNIQKLMSDPSTSQGAMLSVFEKIQGLRPEKQTEALIRLFGNEAGPKMLKLANNVKEYRRQLDLVNGQEKGSMNKEYQKRIASASAQWQIFKNKINELWVKIGTNLLPSFIKAAEWLGRLTEKIGRFIDKHPTLVSWLGKAAAAFSVIALVVGGLSFVIGGVTQTFGLLAKAIRFLNPWVLLIAAAAYIIIRNWDKIKAFFKRLWDGVKNIFQTFWKWLKFVFLNFTPLGLIIKHWKPISDFFSGLWDGIKNICRIVWEAITGIITRPIAWIKEKWKALTEWFRGIFDKIAGFAKKAFGFIKGLFKGPGAMVEEAMDKQVQAELEKKMQKTAQVVDDYLPHSPAKKGPLSRLHKVRIAETIAESIKPNALFSKMNSLTRGIAGAGIPGGRIGSAGQPMNFEFNITLTGGATKQDGALVAVEIKKQFAQMMKQYGSQKERVTIS